MRTTMKRFSLKRGTARAGSWNGAGLVLGGLLALVGGFSSVLQAAERPNILFIFADDLSYEMVHATGNSRIITPNLDRLATSGMVFTHAYNMGSWSGAVCVASRTMLNTGRFVWHAERVYHTAEKERQAGRFWSEYLKRAGYETYMTGKWHIQANAQKAFNYVVHVRPGMPRTVPQAYNRPIEGQPDQWHPWDKKFGGFWEGGKHWSEVAVDDFNELLGEAKKDKKPWFIYLAFNATHDPRQSPQEFLDRYPLQRIAIPDNYQPLYPFREAMGAGERLRDERLAPFPRTPFAIKTHPREYFSLMTHMDVQIGRILEMLEKSGHED